MDNVTIDEIRLAFLKLKNHIYHDKTDLALRILLARFEQTNEEGGLFEELHTVLNLKYPYRSASFKRWLDEIDYRIVPKKISSERSDSRFAPGTYITNIVGSEKYNVEKVNYFFSGPLQLHIIAVLWVMREGKYLDSVLGNECYGARLDISIHKGRHSNKIYRRYHELYKKWRDLGMAKAEQMLIYENKSVCILGLDIQEYYYHVNVDYDAMHNEIAQGIDNLQDNVAKGLSLTKCLKVIADQYRARLAQSLTKTHEGANLLPVGLPIGLISSPLIANWYLRKFDVAIKEKIRPAYYGRYVDDVLIVLESPKDINFLNAPVDALMEGIFVESKVLLPLTGSKYEIAEPSGLFLQQEKCILQQFDPRYSIAGLRKFKKKLEENASDFLLLPVEEVETSLEDASYDLIYDGSTNKFRSVKGISENRYELAKQLAKQTILHLFTDDKVDRKFTIGILNFFKGKSVIEFSDLWERVVTLFLVAKDDQGLAKFKSQINIEISKIEFRGGDEITSQLREALLKGFNLSLSMARALCKSRRELMILEDSAALLFRSSNMIRHHFVRIPLLNFTQYRGPLITGEIINPVKLDKKSIRESPRFVNFDECLMLTSMGILKSKKEYRTPNGQYEYAKRIFNLVNHKKFAGAEWVSGGVNDA